ncbi:MAG: ABC transporter substrate-binding protein, partial [Oscillospiraceae bacterium]|nr:ABC transporter substrate-binding protein [Oscillospiraceae bacterium]
MRTKTRRRRAAFSLALSLIFLASCGAAEVSETPSVANASQTLSVTDDLGRTVAAPRRPQRVAALIGSFADVWSLAGGLETLVAAADDAWTAFELPLGDGVFRLGGVLHPNLETLLSAEPDLILASCDTAPDMEFLPTFEALNIPALYFRVENLQDYLRMLDICAQITGKPENYALYGDAVRVQAEAAVARQDGTAPSVLCLRSGGTSCKAKGSQ